MVTVKAKSRSEMTTGSCVMELRADCNAAGAETTPGDRTRLSSGPGGPGERMCAACGHQSCLHDQPQKQPLSWEKEPQPSLGSPRALSFGKSSQQTPKPIPECAVRDV